MRRTVTSCAAVCLSLMSAGRSVANVSMSFPDSWAQLEGVANHSWVLDAQFGRTAIASPERGSFTWAGPYPFFGDIVAHKAVGGAAPAADAPWAPGEPVPAGGTGMGNVALPDSAGLSWPAISTRPAGYFGPARGLPPNQFSGVHMGDTAYAYMDLTDLAETSALGELGFGPNLPSGAIVSGGVAVGLIGWLWRRRTFSR